MEETKNRAAAGKAVEIQREGAPVRVLVVRTNEELEIALQAEAVIEKELKTVKGNRTRIKSDLADFRG